MSDRPCFGRAKLIRYREIPLRNQPVAKCVDLVELHAGVEQHNWEWDLAEECLTDHPQQRS